MRQGYIAFLNLFDKAKHFSMMLPDKAIQYVIAGQNLSDDNGNSGNNTDTAPLPSGFQHNAGEGKKAARAIPMDIY